MLDVTAKWFESHPDVWNHAEEIYTDAATGQLLHSHLNMKSVLLRRSSLSNESFGLGTPENLAAYVNKGGMVLLLKNNILPKPYFAFMATVKTYYKPYLLNNVLVPHPEHIKAIDALNITGLQKIEIPPAYLLYYKKSEPSNDNP